MKNVFKIVTRFVIGTVIIALILVIVNAVFLSILIFQTPKNYKSRSKIITISKELKLQNGKYVLGYKGEQAMNSQYKWVMLLDDRGKVIWSKNMPQNIPKQYSISEVSSFSKWYLKDYPVDTWNHPSGLLVLGNDRDYYWKYSVQFTSKFIGDIPKHMVEILILNTLFAFLLAVFLGVLLYRSLSPVAKGIENIVQKKPVQLPCSGILGNLSSAINKTSREIQLQRIALKKRDDARTNWIAGVSHDIRTPLSMVMGYASQIQESAELPMEVRDKAEIIQRQSIKIKQFVSDLNLVSKLEYDMQPLNLVKIFPEELIREIAADFLNNGLEDKYNIDLIVSSECGNHMIFGDYTLLKRAISNLIQNSINHNPGGCNILIKVYMKKLKFIIEVKDNGAGIEKERLSNFYKGFQYGNGHGMGLLIVNKIIKVHKGNFNITSGLERGVSCNIELPTINS